MGNPGGDGDGTVSLPFCPYCKKRKLFSDFDEMRSHVAAHEGAKRTSQELEEALKRRG